MNEPLDFVIGLIIGFLIGIIIASASVGSVRSEAIELGHAYYHPQTGDFTWMPACADAAKMVENAEKDSDD